MPIVEIRHHISIILINFFILLNSVLSSSLGLRAMGRVLSSKKATYTVVFIKGFSFTGPQKVLYHFFKNLFIWIIFLINRDFIIVIFL